MKKIIVFAILAVSAMAFAETPVADSDSASVSEVRSHIVTRFTARVAVSNGGNDKVLIEYTSTRAGVLASVLNGYEYCVEKATQAELDNPDGSVEVIGCVVAPVKEND